VRLKSGVLVAASPPTKAPFPMPGALEATILSPADERLTCEDSVVYASHASHFPTCRSLLLAFALCTMPAAVGAQEVVTEVSPQQMTKILTSMGLEVQEGKPTADDKHPPIKFDLAGYGVMLFLYNDNTDAQLFVGFRRKVNTDRINEWNREHRFARAYRDKDGQPVLETDIDFTGGVTEANIKAWVKIFRDLTGEYVKFLR
jgi:hypothetical protein